jgi:trk system potassium uptake protein TrkH
LLEDITFLEAAYECASALGTAGLTTGITTRLSAVAHVLLICLMYLGRVGILSFSLAFLNERNEVSRMKYPTVDVLIG